MSSGERPIGAAKGKQSDTEALCQPPPPPVVQCTVHRESCGGDHMPVTPGCMQALYLLHGPCPMNAMSNEYFRWDPSCTPVHEAPDHR